MKKRILMVVTTAMAFCMGANAQSVLGNLTFEAPKKFVRPTAQYGNYVNVRKTPSTKAAKAKSVNFLTLLGVEQENSGWYKTQCGWISKSVVKVSKNAPIVPEMLNRYCAFSTAYDDAVDWTVVPIKGEHGFSILYREQDNFFYEPWGLWLGKQVGDVFVFKYRVCFKMEDGEGDNDLQLKKEEEGDEIFYKLVAGKNYQTEKIVGGMSRWMPDFTKFNEKIIEKIFKEVIEKNSVEYYYINSELLSGEFAEWIFG